ncbi:MAG: hypothetical protein IJU70_09435 [Lentisphaeria bacterium]|nr:hypothetical protein [Lentisphaeria bacterium]
MSEGTDEFLRMPNWYPYLASHAFPTAFVRLRPEAAALLAASDEERALMPGSVSKQVVEDLRQPMSKIPGNCFTSTDTCSPTDTERFLGKRGAVYSPESAWRFLLQSEKIRHSAAAGQVNFICLRPFRRINQAREFRLFIRGGVLSAMSQYWLIRHFPLLDKNGKHYWNMARKLADDVVWQLPVSDFVMDIYITRDEDILIIDLNPWGPPTDPLLLRDWDRDDWMDRPGLKVMLPPTKISGNVHVSF